MAAGVTRTLAGTVNGEDLGWRRRVRPRRTWWQVLFSPSTVWRLCGALLVFVVIVGAWSLVRTKGGHAPASAYAGTPALAFPVGAAGLIMPAPERVRSFTAAQVDSALKLVKGALVAGHLDRKMLVSRQTDGFVELFAMADREDVRQTFLTGSFSGAAVRIAPGAPLGPEQPRVSGTTKVSTSVDGSGLEVLEVVSNYVWVYSFANNALVVVHDEQRWWIYHKDDVKPNSAGLWLNYAKASAVNIDCTMSDKQFLGPGKLTGLKPEAFNPAIPINAASTCS